MKKHNTVKVVLITILVLLLLTWILPAASFSSEYVEEGRIQMGLFDLFNYPLTALSYFGYIALFVLAVGGFYGILHKIPAYRSFLDKIATTLSKRGKLVLSIIMILLAVITSICGLQLGLIIFFPMLVSIILLMGYDKIVAALTLVGSTMIGIAGTTFAYSNTSLIISVLSLDITSEMLTKVIILVVGLVLLIFNTMLYIKKASRIRKNTKKEEKKDTVVAVEETKTKAAPSKTAKVSKTTKNTKASAKSTKKSSKSSKKDNKAAVKEDEVIVVKDVDEECYVPKAVTGKHKVWPMIVGFSIIFVILILAFIPWSNAFKINAFETATSNVTGVEIFGFPLFGKLLGTVNAFGSWSITDMITVLAIVTLLLALIYKVKLNDVFDGFANGVKKALTPAFIVILIYTCLVIVTYHPFQLVIYKAILGLTKGFNIFTSSLVALLASLFNSDPSYVFQSALPYLASVVTKTANYSIIGVIFQAMYGLTMLIAPTSLILMIVLSYLEIPYKQWFKAIWKLLLELLVVFLIIFTILVLI